MYLAGHAFLGLKRGIEVAASVDTAGDITVGIHGNPLIIKGLKMIKN